MVAPLIPFAIGGFTELQRQREETDDIAGRAVDIVSKQVLGIEIPQEQNVIKKQNEIRDQYESLYGPEATTVLDAYGIFESGNESTVAKKFESFLGSTSVDKFVSNAKNLATSDKKLYNQLISQSFVQKRQLKLEDRQQRIDKIFNDRPNIKDFLIKPEERRTGLAGALIGDQLTKKDLPVVTQRLMGETQAKDVDTKDFVSLISIQEKLGIKPGSSIPGFSTEQSLSIINSARKSFDQNNIYKNVYDTAAFRSEYQKYKQTPQGKEDKRTINDYAFDTYYLPQEISRVKQIMGISTQTTDKQTTLSPSELLIQQAKDAINTIKSSNPADANERIEAIKQELRSQLGVQNLSEYGL
jgi:hypothetical protein